MSHSIYVVNVYPKGKEHEPPALVWEGSAPNLIDAFAQARRAFAPTLHASCMLTLLAEKRDYDAQQIHSDPVLLRRVLNNSGPEESDGAEPVSPRWISNGFGA